MDIREFAKRLGVSTTTVSHALNGKRPVKAATKQLILEKMNEWGYVPNTNARRLVSSKTNLIAFFSDSSDTLADPYQLEVTRNFCRLLRERGYDLLLDLCHTGENDRYASLRNRVMAHSIDGSIIIAGSLTEKDFETLAAPYAPCVYIDTRGLGRMKNAVSISVNCEPAYTEVFRCLKQTGRRRLAFLARHDEDPFYHFWRDALPGHGFQFHPDFCAFTEEDTEQARDAALRMLLASPRPDAIIARTDAQAQGVLRATQQMGSRHRKPWRRVLFTRFGTASGNRFFRL